MGNSSVKQQPVTPVEDDSMWLSKKTASSNRPPKLDRCLRSEPATSPVRSFTCDSCGLVVDAAIDEDWATVAAEVEVSDPIVSRTLDGVDNDNMGQLGAPTAAERERFQTATEHSDNNTYPD